jgi:hypothetical protein
VVTGAALIVVGMVQVMLGWIGRNYVTYGTFMAGSSGEGLPFAAVNNPVNYSRGRLRGLNMVDTAPSVFTTDSGYVDENGAFTLTFLRLPELEQDRLLKEATWRWIRQNPGKVAIMALFKWKAIWLSPQTYNWPRWARLFNWALYLGIVLPFCVVGVYYVTRVDSRLGAPMLIWPVIALYITALQTAFEGEIRHRIAFEPGMIILACAGLEYAYRARQTQKRRRVAPAQEQG